MAERAKQITERVMTDKAKQIREKIARMDDLVMDDLFSLTDDELLQELTEEGIDVAAVGTANREAFERARALVRRKRITLVVREMAEVAGGAPWAYWAKALPSPDPIPAEKRLATGGGGGGPEQPEAQSIVFVVDDDASLREALKSLLRSVGLRVEVFGSAADFLKHHRHLDDGAACLVLDIRLPGQSGLDFQAELAKAGIQIPIIFISGHGDIPMSVRAMKAGAFEFLTKPFREQDLLDAVQEALDRDRKRRTQDKAVREVRARFEALTPREQQVISLVTAGMMNKQTAAELGVSEITVKVHRGNVMKKMGARSLADLVRMADTLGIRRTRT